MAECEDISGETFYQSYINEAPLIPGDHGIPPEKLDLPNSDLYDKQLIEKGKEFVRRNFFAVFLSVTLGSLGASTVKPVRAVLLRQSGVHTKETAFKRYLNKASRLKTWYERDFTAQDTLRDLNTVRRHHRLAARRHSSLHNPQLPQLSPDDRSFLKGMHQVTSGTDDTDFPEVLMRENPQIPISQFDMVTAQIGFIGLLVTHPKSLGIHDTQGFEGFIRLWSLMGRQLGIQDRFNAALHYEKTGGKTNFFHLFEQRIGVGCLKRADETALIMAKAMLEGLSAHNPLLRCKPIVQLTLKVVGLPAHLLDEHMDWRDRVSYRILDFVSGQLTKWTVGRLVCNSAARIFFWIALRLN